MNDKNPSQTEVQSVGFSPYGTGVNTINRLIEPPTLQPIDLPGSRADSLVSPNYNNGNAARGFQVEPENGNGKPDKNGATTVAPDFRPEAPPNGKCPSAPPLFRRRARTGAVAQLPKPERDMVSRMIESGVPYRRIAEAVDAAGFEVSERNISNWVTRGGFLEWQLLRDHSLENRLRQDDLLDQHRC